MDSFNSAFQLRSFLIFCLFVLAKISSIMLTRSDVSKHLFLVSYLTRKVWCFSQYNVSCWFFMDVFYKVKFSPMPTLLSIFIMKGFRFGQILFQHLLRWLCRFFPFILLIVWYYTLIDFVCLTNLAFLRIIPLSCCPVLLMCCWI